eukprot:14941931-Alexandrium_andersonii.AAC.1
MGSSDGSGCQVLQLEPAQGWALQARAVDCSARRQRSAARPPRPFRLWGIWSRRRGSRSDLGGTWPGRVGGVG